MLPCLCSKLCPLPHPNRNAKSSGCFARTGGRYTIQCAHYTPDLSAGLELAIHNDD